MDVILSSIKFYINPPSYVFSNPFEIHTHQCTYVEYLNAHIQRYKYAGVYKLMHT